MLTYVSFFLVALAIVELCLWALFRIYKPGFKWLVGPDDVAPEIPNDLIAKHSAGNFDAELGWIPKPGSHGVDDTADGRKAFNVDDRGRRLNPGFEGREPIVAVFGDSFAFCRLVSDGETWPHLLSKSLNVPVHNYGVGNYGLDQAVLRLEREDTGPACRAFVMAIVPETVARVQSYWKHYLEYGNVLAFKPRFRVANDHLEHLAPAVRRPSDYLTYRTRLADIQSADEFFSRKFSKDVLQFPYVIAVGRRFWRHLPIFGNLLLGSLTGRRDHFRRRAFSVVLRDNGRLTMNLFREVQSTTLMDALIRRYCASCKQRGAEAILVVLPQPGDCEAAECQRASYEAYFSGLVHRSGPENQLKLVDMTRTFLGTGDWRSHYVQGPLGPHLNGKGNRLVADTLKPLLTHFQARRDAPKNEASPNSENSRLANNL